jgi:[ribosomal protein S5]-alanine N-acetyltransferase
MILRTPRLILRRARITDVADLHDAMSRPQAMRYWSTPEHEAPEVTRAFVQGMIDGHSDDFVVEHQGRVIGKAGAWCLPEVGFLLHPDFWGKGLASEAMQAVITHLFATHPIPALTAEADPRNAACIGLLSRLGFAETHRAERTLLWRDEWCDSVYFALSRTDWPPR